MPYERAAPISPEEIAYVKETLADVQRRSLEEGVEFCGFIGMNTEGEFLTWPATRGEVGYCEAKYNYFDRKFYVLANYHTHGSPSAEHESETPSFVDIYSTMLAGQDGYVVTPRGRLWYLDSQLMTAKLICGLKCMPYDNSVVDDFDFNVGDVFTIDEIEALYGREFADDAK